MRPKTTKIHRQQLNFAANSDSNSLLFSFFFFGNKFESQSWQFKKKTQKTIFKILNFHCWATSKLTSRLNWKWQQLAYQFHSPFPSICQLSFLWEIFKFFKKILNFLKKIIKLFFSSFSTFSTLPVSKHYLHLTPPPLPSPSKWWLYQGLHIFSSSFICWSKFDFLITKEIGADGLKDLDWWWWWWQSMGS